MSLKHLKYLFIGSVMPFASSCDEGKIYDDAPALPEQSGLTLHFTGKVEGIDQWAPGYSVVLAGFGDDAFAIITKQVESTDGEASITMTNISSEVKTVELCVINNLRRRITSYASIDVSGTSGQDIDFNVGTVNAGMFHTIQNVIFDASCVQCHGGSTHAAAGLYLTPGESYDHLVNVPSTVLDGMYRVAPYNAPESTLWQAVGTGVSSDWSFNHSELLNSSSADLIRSWINNGAK